MARTEVLVKNRLTGEIREAWLDDDLDQVVNDRGEEFDYLKWSVIEDVPGTLMKGRGVLAVGFAMVFLFLLGVARNG